MDYLGTVDSYTDFTALNRLKHAGKDGNDDAIREVARQLESLFVNQLLKSMRQANESFSEGSFLSSNETKSYEQMLDNQMSLSLTRGRGIGLADSIVKQLSGGDVKPKKVDHTIDHPFAVGQAVGPGISIADAPRTASPVPFMADAVARSSVSIPLRAPESTSTSLTAQKQAAQKLADTLINKSALDQPITNILTIPTTPDEFIQWVYPDAVIAAKQLGVSPKILIAQSALETGWGQKPILTADGENSYNLFGIKADQRWSGQKASVGTLEYRDGVAKKEQANFRVYESVKESLNDYVRFLKESPRYQHAIEQAGDPARFAESLMKAGYATDPKYAEKIMGIFDGKLLNRVIGAIEK